ncbi:hypothetical protein BDR26DRAFT_913770 [Obelidium mucronatum]|nr:hypothetical protein BDR26DRAFT_913770 [Obelidium mucronatum]
MFSVFCKANKSFGTNIFSARVSTLANKPISRQRLKAAIIIDTNYWLSHASFCSKILDILGSDTPVMVPQAVLKELNVLKAIKPGTLPTNQISQNDLIASSRYAGNVIYQAFLKRKPSIVGQRDEESLITKEYRFHSPGRITNDDLILDYAKYCAKNLATKIYLLSNGIAQLMASAVNLKVDRFYLQIRICVQGQ